MVTLGDDGVYYFSVTQKKWVTVSDGRNIPQADYDAMPSWERYCVLSFFADQGNEPKEVMS